MVHVFPMSELVAAVQAGSEHIACPRATAANAAAAVIQVSQLAPDVALSGIPRIELSTATDVQVRKKPIARHTRSPPMRRTCV